MRKVLRFVPLLLLCLVLVLFLPQQADAATSGYYTYMVSGGEATITDVSTSISGEVTIPSTLGGYPVTSIGEKAFYDCDSLTSVTIPDSVTSIGNNAFYYCTSLTSVTIPDSVTYIGESAFRSCSKLTSVTIPDSVTSIGRSAFRECGNLTSVKIQYGVISIGDYAFTDCWKLTIVTMPDSVTSIGEEAFSCCYSLTSITIPDSVTSIGEEAFYWCNKLTSIAIPKSVASIGPKAFRYCYSLTDISVYPSNQNYCSDANGVLYDKNKSTLIQAPAKGIKGAYTIPDSVTAISDYAFYNCANLTSITIPDCVASIGRDVFHSCTSLTSATVPASVTSIGISMFQNCTSLTSITIPDSVTSIAGHAFYGCTSLTSITIPDSVTSIGGWAFSDCASLTDVYYDGTQEQWDTITIGSSNENLTNATIHFKEELPSCLVYEIANGEVTITGCDTSATGDLIIPDEIEGNPVTGIGGSAFSYCDSLTSVTIPDSVTSIGSYAFSDCSSLTSVTIPEGVTSIGNSAFGYCDSLTSVTVPDSVTSIGDYAFIYCYSLTGIWVDAKNPAYGSDAAGVLYNKDKTTLIQAPGGIAGAYIIPDSVTSIGNYAFSGCDSLTSVTIPDSVTRIGNLAFSDCDSLTSVTIPDSVTGIGDDAFYECTSLTGIWVDAKNPAYCSDAAGVLYNKDKTTLIQAPGGITGAYTIPDSVTSIDNFAFDGCTSLTSITIPDSVTSIGNCAFYGCISLTSVTIPDSVTSFGYSAFSSCNGLTSVTIPDSVTSIGSGAFYLCDSLRHVAYGGTSAQWSKIRIGGYNTKLTGASVWHYEATQDDVYYTKNCINAGIYCNLCGDFLTKEKEESGTHSYDYICDEECNDCGEIRSVTHSFEWIIDKLETCGENGSKHEECTHCHTIRNADTVIPATGRHSYVDDHDTACGACGYIRIVTGIEIGNAPSKLKYSLLRDELDVTGGTIIVTYSDGTHIETAITADMVSGFSDRILGEQKLTITYFDQTTNYKVEVLADYTPDKLEILTKPKTSYILGESLDLNGLTVKATYEDVEVELALSEVSVDVVDLTTIGSKTVTVRYYDAVATFQIFVHEKVWATIDSSLYPESSHNYASNTNETKTFTYPGAEQLKLTFSDKSYTESSCDFVYIYDGAGNQIGKYSGTLAGKVVTVTGDTVQIKLTSDGSVNKYGYAFATIEAYGVEHPGETFCDICGQLMDTTVKSIVLHKDVISDSMTIPVGVTLDLNGYTLMVESLASFGQIIDSVGGGGLIVTNFEATGNDWLPIQDASGCYRFYEYEQENLGTKTSSDGVVFGFTLDFADSTAYSALLATQDVQIVVTLDWGSGSQDYAFSQELVAKYVDWVSKYPTLRPAMQLNVTGLDSLEEGTVITVTPGISAVGGKIQTSGATMTYTA